MDLDSGSILELFNSIKDLIGIRKNNIKSNKPSKSSENLPLEFDGVYQAPVKTDWKNSGNFSPNVATDARHPKGHAGIDIRVSGGTAVYPIAPGIVTNVGTDPLGGNVINIQHPNGVKTYSAHLGSVSVHKGDKVDKETIIGTVGNSGNAQGTPPHIHFQVWENGTLQNPAKYFSVPQYTSISKDEVAWLPGAKEQAKSWSMNQHLQDGKETRLAKTITTNQLLKLANQFYKLSTK
mgnify:CR=1 FL=1